MTEVRILLAATLPMLFGAAWLGVLRRPEPHATNAVHAARSAARPSSAAAREEEAGWPGVVVSGYSAELGAEVAGTVSETLVPAGARVKAGTPLLRIDES